MRRRTRSPRWRSLPGFCGGLPGSWVEGPMSFCEVSKTPVETGPLIFGAAPSNGIGLALPSLPPSRGRLLRNQALTRRSYTL